MKNRIFKLATGAGVMLLLGLGGVSGQNLEKGSTKGAGMLLLKQPAAVQREVQTMSCPTCADRISQSVDRFARGANKSLITTRTHECTGCSTTKSLVGQGKQKHEVVAHSCTHQQEGKPNCCAPAEPPGKA